MGVVCHQDRIKIDSSCHVGLGGENGTRNKHDNEIRTRMIIIIIIIIMITTIIIIITIIII